jgi:hypothetical protein
LPDAVKGPQEEQVLDGHAGPGEVYLMAGEAPTADGRRVTYRDGERFSTVGEGAEVMGVYARHSPEAVAEEETAAEVEDEDVTGEAEAEEEDEGGEDNSDLPAEFRKYIGAVEEAKSFSEVKEAMAEFYKTPLFAGMTTAQQNKIRAQTWGTVEDNALPDKPDHATDVSAFRLWIEACEDPEAINGTLAVLERQPAFEKKDPSFKDAIRRAVASRIETLQA